MIDVISLIERLTGKKATQYDVNWVEELLDREAFRIEKNVEDRRFLSPLKCGCAPGWCDCNG